jgi:transcriptional regulator with XRE-family HTH domain
MREHNLTRADLASRMGVSPGRVSQVLSGGENLTLRTLASLAAALGTQFDLTLSPREPVVTAEPVPAAQETREIVTETSRAWTESLEDANASRTRG